MEEEDGVAFIERIVNFNFAPSSWRSSPVYVALMGVDSWSHAGTVPLLWQIVCYPTPNSEVDGIAFDVSSLSVDSTGCHNLCPKT